MRPRSGSGVKGQGQESKVRVRSQGSESGARVRGQGQGRRVGGQKPGAKVKVRIWDEESNVNVTLTPYTLHES